jgi:anti-sigma B factor antagonist
MSLLIGIRRLDRAVVLELSGSVSAVEQNLRLLVDEFVQYGDRNFVIDLANVSDMDSSGLGQLCTIHAMLKNCGGDMKLLKPTDSIRKLLQIAKLDTVFELLEPDLNSLKTA